MHEIKHDGYRLIVQRDGQRVRLFARNWSFPLITEAALRNRDISFVIDGEAVLLDDGISDFNGLHSRKYDDEVRFYAVDILVNDGEISASFNCISARTTSQGFRLGASTASSCPTSSRARLAPTYSATPA
jgi:ATP dependent DNA ligase domain